MTRTSPPLDRPIVVRRLHHDVSLVLAIAMIAATGWIDLPRRTFRGHSSHSGGSDARLAQSVPSRFGRWTGSDLGLDEESRSAAGVVDHVARSYRDSDSGKVVVLTLVAGSPADIAVHPPTACYRGIGYVPAGEMKSASILSSESNQSQRFHYATFHAESDATLRVQIAWAWSDGRTWETPSSPRLAYVGRSSLRKLYATRSLEPTQQAAMESLDPWIAQFLAELPQGASGDATSRTPAVQTTLEVWK